MPLISSIVLIFVCLVATGCTVSGPMPTDLSIVHIGASRSQIEKALGKPLEHQYKERGGTYVYSFSRGCVGEAQVIDPKTGGYLGPLLIGLAPIAMTSAHSDISEMVKDTMSITFDEDDRVIKFSDIPAHTPHCEDVLRAVKAKDRRNSLNDAKSHFYKESFSKHIILACDNNSTSQYIIAQYYQNGTGVSRNFVESYKWFTLASRDGNKSIIKFREVLADKMTTDEVITAENLVAIWQPHSSDCTTHATP